MNPLQPRSLCKPVVLLSTSALLASTTETNQESMDNESPMRIQSVLWMTVAMSLHFGGYEFIRNATLALFTSKTYGFAYKGAFPLANAAVPVSSLFMLYWYGRALAKTGPRGALRQTTLGSILVIAVLAAAIASANARPLRQILVALLFLWQNSYQYLLYTQQWSFVTSVLTTREGARWFSSIAGVSSLVCTLTGSLVPTLTARGGLVGLLSLTTITLAASLLCSDRAYHIAHTHRFDPKPNNKITSSSKNTGPTQQAITLFRRVPTLNRLLIEVLSFQSLNTILTVIFVQALQQTFPTQDVQRSTYSSKVYLWVNACSTLLQFAVVPYVLPRIDARHVWRVLPILPLLLLLVAQYHQSSLFWAATAFGATKTLDYAVRGVIYVLAFTSLDFEARFVGKELLGVLGSRLGKSGMSLLLGCLWWIEARPLAMVAAGVWMVATQSLSRVLPERASSDEVSKKDQ